MFNKKIKVIYPLLTISFFAFLFSFHFAYAAIVPCGGSGDPCTLCHMIIGIKNLVDWGTKILVTLAIVAIVISGIIYIISSGSSGLMTSAKTGLTYAISGFAIFICAWLIVNTIMWLLAAKADLGVGASNWYTFNCSTQSNALTGATSTNPNNANTANSAAQKAQNEADCKKYCDDGGDGTTDASDCYSQCMSAKATQQAQNAGNSNVTNAAQQMMNAGCQYNQSLRNGCTGNPGYTDCSNFACTSFTNAGCQCPGSTTADLFPKGQSVSDSSSLRAGDVLVTRVSAGGKSDHAVICKNDGCSTVIHASGTKDGIKESNGSYYLNQNPHVVRVSDYCK